MRIFAILIPLLSGVIAGTGGAALAEEMPKVSESAAESSASGDLTVGIGAGVGWSNYTTHVGVAAELTVHYGSQEPLPFGDRLYGWTQLQGDAGVAVSFYGLASATRAARLRGKSGVRILELDSEITPFVGVELNPEFAAVSDVTQDGYAMVKPMGSAGLTWLSDSCRVVVAARGGVSLGDHGVTSGEVAIPAAGGGAYLNCDAFNLAFDYLHLRGEQLADTVDLDASVDLPGAVGSVAVSGRARAVREEEYTGSRLPDPLEGAPGAPRNEFQGFLLFRRAL